MLFFHFPQIYSSEGAKGFLEKPVPLFWLSKNVIPCCQEIIHWLFRIISFFFFYSVLFVLLACLLLRNPIRYTSLVLVYCYFFQALTCKLSICRHFFSSFLIKLYLISTCQKREHYTYTRYNLLHIAGDLNRKKKKSYNR